MRSNAALAGALRKFLRRVEQTTSADDFFYLAHRDRLIERFNRYLRTPEFAPLDYRVVKNDAFHYLTLYLRNRAEHYWDYQLYLLLFDAHFALTYVDYDEPALVRSDADSRFKLRRLTFETVDGLFAYLDLHKAMIAHAAAEMTSGE